MTDRRFRQRWSLRSLRRELVLGEYGLMEVFAFGRTRYTPWRQVRGVRREADGGALLELQGGRPIRLAANMDDLGPLVEAVQEHLLADRARSAQRGIDQVMVREWLGDCTGRPAPRRLRMLAAVCLGCGALLAALFAADRLPEALGMLGALALFAGIETIAWSDVYRYGQRYLAADEEGLACTVDRRVVRVAWSEIRGANLERAGTYTRQARLSVLTVSGRYTLQVPARAVARLLGLLARVAEYNAATLADQMPRAVPDGALSPARATEEGAERGLSQSDTQDLDA